MTSHSKDSNMQLTARAPAGQAGKVALKSASPAKALSLVARPAR